MLNAQENGIYSSRGGTPTTTIFPKGATISLKPVNAPKQGLYLLREIGADQIQFDENLVIGKGLIGTVISGRLFETPVIKFKMYDAFHDASYAELSKREVDVYKKLKRL